MNLKTSGYTDELDQKQMALDDKGRHFRVGGNRTFSVDLVVLCSCFS